MTWKRAELVVSVISGIAIVTALVMLLQNRHGRLVLGLILIGIGVRLLFDLAKRLRVHAPANDSQSLS